MQRQTRGDVGIAPYITFGKLFCEMRTPEGRPYKKKCPSIRGRKKAFLQWKTVDY